MIYRLNSKQLRSLVLDVAHKVLEEEPSVDESYQESINLAEMTAQSVLADFENNTVNENREEFKSMDADDIGLLISQLIKGKEQGYKTKLTNKKQQLSINDTDLVGYTEFKIQMFKGDDK